MHEFCAGGVEHPRGHLYRDRDWQNETAEEASDSLDLRMEIRFHLLQFFKRDDEALCDALVPKTALGPEEQRAFMRGAVDAMDEKLTGLLGDWWPLVRVET